MGNQEPCKIHEERQAGCNIDRSYIFPQKFAMITLKFTDLRIGRIGHWFYTDHFGNYKRNWRKPRRVNRCDNAAEEYYFFASGNTSGISKNGCLTTCTGRQYASRISSGRRTCSGFPSAFISPATINAMRSA